MCKKTNRAAQKMIKKIQVMKAKIKKLTERVDKIPPP
jgi:hypothetical protein